MRDPNRPRKSYVETDSRGRFHFAVEKLRFYAVTLGAVAVAVTVVMGVAGYLLQPYLHKVASAAVSDQLDDYVTRQKFQEYQREEVARAERLASAVNQAARVMDTIERRLEVQSRRLDRLYERQWQSGPNTPGPSTFHARWPPPGDLRPPGWYMRGVPR